MCKTIYMAVSGYLKLLNCTHNHIDFLTTPKQLIKEIQCSGVCNFNQLSLTMDPLFGISKYEVDRDKHKL